MARIRVRLQHMDPSENQLELLVEPDKIGSASLVIFRGLRYTYRTMAGDKNGPIAVFGMAEKGVIVYLEESEFVREVAP